MSAALAALIAFGIAERSASAEACRWTRTASSFGSANFSNQFNWSCGHTPDSDDDVTFDGLTSTNTNCTLNNAVTVNSITIGSSYTATITGQNNNMTVTGAFSLSSAATFTAPTGTVSVGAFSQTNGTFTSTTGVLQVVGAFTRMTAGTFTHNGGTVRLTGTGALTPNGASFNNLIVNTTSGTYTLTGTLTVGGALTMTSGTLTIGANTVAVTGAFTHTNGTFNAGSVTVGAGAYSQANGTFNGGSSAITVSSFSQTGGTFNATSGTMSVGGSWTRSGGSFLPGSGTVRMSASGTITSGGGSFNNLTIDTSATYTLGDALSTIGILSMPTGITGTLTAGAYAVTVGSTFSQAGGTFNASTGTTTVTGAFSRSGGTFVANGGTLLLNGTGTLAHSFSGATLGKVVLGQDNGLVGYWKLDESSGASYVDSSPYANNGTLIGGYSRTTPPSTITFTDTNALTFNGTTASGTAGVTGLPANNAAQTISFWVRLASNGGIQNMVTLVNAASSSAVQVGTRNNLLTMWSYGGTSLVTTTLPSINVWHHVAYTFNGTTHRLYLDGVAGTATTAAAQTGTPIWTYFGSYDGINEFLNGSLDDVRVYNRQLSASEVATLNAGSELGSVTGGTHTFSDAFICSDDLVIGAGSLVGSSTMRVDGSWLNTGGSFSGLGAVTLRGSTTDNVVVSRGGQFPSLTIDGSGGTYTFADAMVDTGNLTIASGVTVAGAGTMTVGGNWDNSGSFLGTGAITLTGTGARTLKSNGGRFASLTLNGSGGTYTLQDRLWVPGGTVTLLAGTLATAANTARMGAMLASGGAFTQTTGTLIFDGASDQSSPVATYGGSLRFEDPTESNLVAYWKLDAGVGRQVYDFTRNGNDGTLTSAGATWQTTVGPTFGFENPASVVLNGSSGYARMTGLTLPANSAAQTISFWANLNSTTGTQTMVALSNSATNAIEIGIGGGALTASNWGGTTLMSRTAPSTGAWHHIVYTYDGAGNQSFTVDGVTTTGTTATTNLTGPATFAYLGTNNGGGELFAGAIDDVRVYNVVLTSAQIAQLAAGRYAGTGGIATHSLIHNTTVGGQLFIDNANFVGNDRTMSANGATAASQINTGTYAVSSATHTFSGGLTVQGGATLSLTSSTSVVTIGSGKTLTMDGTLVASNGMINGSGAYAFKVGSTSTARPTLNITGLAVRNTDANGMWINTVSGASTTFTNFRNVAFNNGVAGAGSQYLQISSPSLSMALSDFSFGVGENLATLPGAAVKLIGNGTADGETRLVIGATCSADKTDTSGCFSIWKTDDDNNNGGLGDGIGDNTGTNGAVVQLVRGAATDTAGSIVGLPTAAFDWNNFSYYSTYVAFRDASGTADRLYVRDQTGAAKYYWDTPSGEEMVGVPRWTTVGTTHYVYVATASGKIYRLIDNTTSQTLTQDTTAPWDGANNPFDCGCTIVTPLVMDTNNLYWGGTQSSVSKVWTLGQASRTGPALSPVSVTPLSVTTAAPALWVDTATTTTYLFVGVVGHILKINVSTQTIAANNTSPGTASIYGRITMNSFGTSMRVFAGDSAGTMWAIDPNNFAGPNDLITTDDAVSVWSYVVPSDGIRSSPYWDFGTSSLHFGTESGKVVVLNSTGGVLLSTYPYTPTGTGPIRTEVLYRSGILAVGTTTGKLFFLDRNNGSNTAALVRQYYFGATEAVSGIGFDASTNRYLVTTADATSKDGKLYVIDAITDPTATSL